MRVIVKALALPILLVSALAFAGNWSMWQSFSNNAGVSVSFSDVDSETYTWRFRNDGERTITFLSFEYTDKDGTHSDVLPGDLAPHAIFGGWAAFTASSRPTIRLLKVTRQ
jgi:hypothetical protein